MCIQMSITETPRKRPTASRNNKLSKKIIKDYPKKILYEPSGNTLVSKFHQLSMKKEKTKRKKLINKPNVFYRLYEDARRLQKNVSNSKTDSIKLSQTKKLVHPDLWEIHKKNVNKIDNLNNKFNIINNSNIINKNNQKVDINNNIHINNKYKKEMKKNEKSKKKLKLDILENFDEKTLIKKIRDSINKTFYHYKKYCYTNGNNIQSKLLFIIFYFLYFIYIVSNMFIYYCTDFFENEFIDKK